MAGERTGPSTPTIVLIAVLATPVVLILIFWLIGSGGGDNAQAKTIPMPNLVGKGLEWAKDKAKTNGHVETHDALGRDRHWSDDKDWVVCFQDPAAGTKTDKKTKIQLAAVKLDEKCPGADQALYKRASTEMPNLKNRTGYMASKILGDKASVLYIAPDGDEVNGNLGDWRVCSQQPKSGQAFDGVPVTLLVVDYEDRC
jgi:beta-lactam-binding protein with PASTA domain